MRIIQNNIIINTVWFTGMSDAFEIYGANNSTNPYHMYKLNLVTGVLTDLGTFPINLYPSAQLRYVCPNGRLFLNFENSTSVAPNYQNNVYTYYNGTWALIAQLESGTNIGNIRVGTEIDASTFLLIGYNTSNSTLPYWKASVSTGAIVSSGNLSPGTGVTIAPWVSNIYWGSSGFLYPAFIQYRKMAIIFFRRIHLRRFVCVCLT